MTIQFEKAAETDAERLTEVQKVAFESQAPPEMPDLGGPEGYDSVAWQVTAMRTMPYFKILRDGEIVGGIVLETPEPGHAHVERIFIHPDHHNEGIGTRAFAFLEGAHPEVRLWTLRTPQFHARNQRFYERRGYRRTGGTLELFPGFTLVEFEKRIESAQTLPPLPPMPAVPAPRPPGSVPMGDPDAVPETRLDFPIADGPYQPTWESISGTYPAADSDWLREAKFGIWVHFGAQSAGRSGDWYARRLYLQDGGKDGKYAHHYRNHQTNFGHPSEVGYKDVLRNWNPDKLDPAAQVRLYHDAGARFLFIQAVHHDNFDHWDSKYQPWNSVNLGPRRDLLREWTAAAREAGMRWGAAFHHEYTWWWYQTAFGSDTTGPKAGVPYDGHLTLADGRGTWWEGYDPRLLYTIDLREYQGLDVEFAPAKGIFSSHQEYARWYATWWAYRMMDVVENYDPDFLYTDGNSTQPFSGFKSGTGMKSDALQRVIAHYYNRTLARRGAVDTFSIVKFSPPRRGVVSTKEGSIPLDIKTDQPWIGETAVGDWFYAPGFVYDFGSVIRYLLENAARDGATAICVCQQPDGSLDEGSQKMLREVGAWLRVNGAGVYGSRAWVTLGEGDTTPDGKLRVLPGGKLGQRQAEFAFSPRDFRFTVGKDGALYAFCMTVPAPGTQLRVTSLGTDAGRRIEPVRAVTLLGSDARLEWKQERDALVVRCPPDMPFQTAVAFKIE